MAIDEQWLDRMQAMLSEVCKAHDWDLIQTSALPLGTRSFSVRYGSKNVTVLVSSLVSTRVEADVIFEHDDIEFDEDQIGRILAAKLR
jgi:hypothetical protein